MKRIIVIPVILSIMLMGCGGKKNAANTDPNAIAQATPTPTVTPQSNTDATPAPASAAAIPGASQSAAPPAKKEVKVNDEKNNKILQEAPKNVEERVVTSAVAKSVDIPEDFPLNYLPIIQGAQITEATKTPQSGGAAYKLTQKVNISHTDAYEFYDDLFASSHSYKVEASEPGNKITVTRAKSGLAATLTFTEDGEGSIAVIEVTVTE